MPAPLNEPTGSERVPTRPALLMLSHVPPLPRTSGQRQRVYYTLEALRAEFDVTLVLDSSSSGSEHLGAIEALCDELIVLPQRRRLPGRIDRYVDAGVETVYSVVTGLKRSNLRIQREFAADRLGCAVDLERFDLVYFQYWHASVTAEALRRRGLATVVDLHDILWRSRETNLVERRHVPDWYVRSATARYRRREEQGWLRFDLLVAINEAERDMVAEGVGVEPWYVPMGLPLEDWPRRYSPEQPLRLAYFGAITSRQREAEVLRTVQGVMPEVWTEFEDTEIRIVGNGPGDRIQALQGDERVRVTGFVDDVGAEIAGAAAVVCPFVGQYGFRSRLIEILATGTPIVATPDAVWGMSLGPDDGVLLGASDEELAGHCRALLRDEGLRVEASARARAAAQRFGFDETYGAFARRLREHLCLGSEVVGDRIDEEVDC